MALPALLDRMRPVDVGFQVNVHGVSVWAVMKPRTSLASRILGIFICLVSGFLGLFVSFISGGFEPALVGVILGLVAGFVFNNLTGITPKQTK